MKSPTASEIGKEARLAFERSRVSPKEHFQRLIRWGFINSRGEVTTLLGGSAEPEVELNPDGTPVLPDPPKTP